MSERDPIHQLAYHDAEAAWSIAKSLWGSNKGTPEAFQATFATTLIHIQNLRKAAPPARPVIEKIGLAAPAPQAKAAPAAAPAASGIVSECPKCHGPVWDNRKDIKPGERKAKWRCKNKECKDEEGYTVSEWSKEYKNPQKNTAYAEAHAARDTFDAAAVDFNQPPPQLQGGDDLPF